MTMNIALQDVFQSSSRCNERLQEKQSDERSRLRLRLGLDDDIKLRLGLDDDIKVFRRLPQEVRDDLEATEDREGLERGGWKAPVGRWRGPRSSEQLEEDSEDSGEFVTDASSDSDDSDYNGKEEPEEKPIISFRPKLVKKK
jgi:hypothetical protein